jgi:hypothetical protein
VTNDDPQADGGASGRPASVGTGAGSAAGLRMARGCEVSIQVPGCSTLSSRCSISDQSQPASRAIRMASIRLRPPIFVIAFDK